MRRLSTIVFACALIGTSVGGFGPGQHTASAVACAETLHDGFTSAAVDGLKLNGSATITGGNLRLTNSTGQSASAWSTSAVSLLGDASFSTSFTLKFSSPTGGGADGMVFAVQTQSNSAGGLGGGLGFDGITPSIGIEFDDFQNGTQNDPDNHHMAIDLNGSVNHGSPVPAGRLFTTSTNFFTTGTWYVWVDYNGVTTTLEGRISTTNSRPASAQVSIVDDLPARLGTTSAFVGFTAATGLFGGTHEVLKWRFFPCYNPNPDGTAQSITFAALSDRTLVQSPVTVSATASSGLAVSFSSGTPSVCTVSGTTVTLVAAGTCSVIASQPGNATYAAADPVTRSFAVSKAAQSITFLALSDRTPTQTPFSLSATASSGLPVSFASSTASVCTVSGATVTLVAQGTCTITASQAGNATYSAATPVTRSFAFSKASQTIAFEPLRDRTLVESPLSVTATSDAGLRVDVSSSTPTVCTVSNRTVTLLAHGTCTLTASQAGTADVEEASVSRSFAVTRLPQTIDTISIDTLAEHFVGEAPTALTGTASSGLSVAFAVSGACTLKDGLLSFTKEGDCVITQSQAGDATYLPAADVKRTIKVKVLRPAIVVAPEPAPRAGPSVPAPAPTPVPTRQGACGPVPSGTAIFLGRPGYHSAWAGQSEFISAALGQPFEYCFLLRNTGTLPWLSGTRSTQINLGANTPQDSTAYVDRGIISAPLYNRNRFATAQEDVVRPGEYATFIIKGRAPATAGVQRIDVAPVIDGVQWLEDEGIYFLIAVR